MNNFQGRYVILHPWAGAVACENPQRGSWGGPPVGGPPMESATSRLTTGAAAMPAPVSLAAVVEDGLPTVAPAQVGLPERGGTPAPAPTPEEEPDESRCQTAPGAGWLAVVGLLALRRRQ